MKSPSQVSGQGVVRVALQVARKHSFDAGPMEFFGLRVGQIQCQGSSHTRKINFQEGFQDQGFGVAGRIGGQEAKHALNELRLARIQPSFRQIQLGGSVVAFGQELESGTQIRIRRNRIGNRVNPLGSSNQRARFCKHKKGGGCCRRFCQPSFREWQGAPRTASEGSPVSLDSNRRRKIRHEVHQSFGAARGKHALKGGQQEDSGGVLAETKVFLQFQEEGLLDGWNFGSQRGEMGRGRIQQPEWSMGLPNLAGPLAVGGRSPDQFFQDCLDPAGLGRKAQREEEEEVKHEPLEYRWRSGGFAFQNMKREFDVLVVGGGHAGAEAAHAAARLGARTLLLTQDPMAVGRMSCNPAIGGLGKGQMVREIDALGGLMGLAADAAGIQFRLLNTSKGRAVQSPRAQCDRQNYEIQVQELLAAQANLEICAGEVVDLQITAEGRVFGVHLADGSSMRAMAVILTTGTFLQGELHFGTEKSSGGRFGEKGASALAEALGRAGLSTGRLKTGTPPRLTADSIAWNVLEEQPGDEFPTAFSFLTDSLPEPQISCWIAQTNSATHQIVRDNLHLSPMVAGRIQGRGPRYCPSLEDKVVRFADRDSHQIYLEPEGRASDLIYANGLSTSLPVPVQEQFLRTIVGLENCRIAQPGYAVEYTFVHPGSLRPTLEVRERPGLFLAGQICGTSGYEEAAGQGLLAGFNAALAVAGRDPFLLGRDRAYLGVMVDDLVVSDPREPYRMFTSRAEHRILLRQDTADRRLTPLADSLGAVSEERVQRLRRKQKRLSHAMEWLKQNRAVPPEGGPPKSFRNLVARPDLGLRAVEGQSDLPPLTREESLTLEADLQYAGYEERQRAWADRASDRDQITIPEDLDVSLVQGMRAEAVESIQSRRPTTLGAAGRLAGVSPADLAVLELHCQASKHLAEASPGN